MKKLPPMHLVCGKDALRNNMNHVYIFNGHAVATDANMMVSYKLNDFFKKEQLDILEGKTIHYTVWKKICSVHSILLSVSPEGITSGADPEVGSILYRFSAPQETLNSIRRVWNESLQAQVSELPQIQLNPLFFESAGKILNHEALQKGQMRLRFTGATKAIMAFNPDNPNAMAIVMPQFSETPSEININNFIFPL